MFCLVTEATRIEQAEFVTLGNIFDLDDWTRHRSYTISTKVFSILLKTSSPAMSRTIVMLTERATKLRVMVPWPRNISLVASVGMVMGLSIATHCHRFGTFDNG